MSPIVNSRFVRRPFEVAYRNLLTNREMPIDEATGSTLVPDTIDVVSVNRRTHCLAFCVLLFHKANDDSSRGTAPCQEEACVSGRTDRNHKASNCPKSTKSPSSLGRSARMRGRQLPAEYQHRTEDRSGNKQQANKDEYGSHLHPYLDGELLHRRFGATHELRSSKSDA